MIWFLQPGRGTKAPRPEEDGKKLCIGRLERMATGVTGRAVCDWRNRVLAEAEGLSREGLRRGTCGKLELVTRKSQRLGLQPSRIRVLALRIFGATFSDRRGFPIAFESDLELSAQKE